MWGLETKKIKEIIKLIVKKTKGGIPNYGEIDLRRDETLKLYPNISKVRKFLDWSPKVKFSKGLKQTINYYAKKKYL